MFGLILQIALSVGVLLVFVRELHETALQPDSATWGDIWRGLFLWPVMLIDIIVLRRNGNKEERREALKLWLSLALWLWIVWRWHPLTFALAFLFGLPLACMAFVAAVEGCGSILGAVIVKVCQAWLLLRDKLTAPVRV